MSIRVIVWRSLIHSTSIYSEENLLELHGQSHATSPGLTSYGRWQWFQCPPWSIGRRVSLCSSKEDNTQALSLMFPAELSANGSECSLLASSVDTLVCVACQWGSSLSNRSTLSSCPLLQYHHLLSWLLKAFTFNWKRKSMHEDVWEALGDLV